MGRWETFVNEEWKKKILGNIDTGTGKNVIQVSMQVQQNAEWFFVDPVEIIPHGKRDDTVADQEYRKESGCNQDEQRKFRYYFAQLFDGSAAM